MNAGRLNKRITIQASTYTVNEYGEQERTWSDFAANQWARVEPLTGQEYFAAQQFQSKVAARITLRPTTGINTQMRVLYNSQPYNIVSVIDPHEAGTALILMCSKVNT